MDAHDLRRLRRIDGFDLLPGLDPLAAEDEVILAAQLAAHLVDRCPHLARVFFAAEINRRFVDKWAFMQADL
jgi:hypothetical protein